jgi:uncharacterized repeat protein (TIGR03803 family)
VFSGTNGATPHARLLQGSDGYFYGTTYEGGALGYGTVFKLTHAGDLTTLYSFGGSDGANPMSGLVQSSDGNIYGTTWNGGADGYGTVFKITPDGTLTTLYSFPGLNDGLRPYSALVQGDDGSFYGTAGGGKNNVGSSFKITTAGAFTRLYADFYRGRNGAAYPSGLVKGSDGNFYGGAGDGGYDGYGAIFQMTPNGAFTILFSFAGSNGSEPGTPVQGSDGELYGTTFQNGSGPGTVFKISTNGAHTVLHYFTGTDGKNPVALIQGSDGDYYGTTYAGGTSTNGTVFKITASGVLTSLYSFNGIDGSSPYRLVQGSDGNFYGTTYAGGTYFNGTVFKITANGAFTSLYSFTGGNDGANPYGSLLEASDGSFYGTTPFGGAYTNGTVFKIRANGVFTTLCSFTGSNDGANPYAGLARGNDGYLYGTTYGGGAGKVGTVFRMAIAPEFIAIAVTNGAISLTWSSETGKKYQLQYGSEVNSGSWANVGNPLTASGSTLSATDFVANDPQRLYRVVALPQ